MGLRVAEHEGWVELTIDRPARRNALDGPLWDSLTAEGERLHGLDGLRAVILTGGGGHFCAGMDLTPSNAVFQEIVPLVGNRDLDGLVTVIERLKATFSVFATLPVPVIAAIEGACAGGGLELALAADLRVAGDGAFFSLPETLFGMVPDVGGTTRLSKLVGSARAAELILTGNRIDAATADRWGLVNRVVPAGTALDAAREMVHRIHHAAPFATAEALKALRSVTGLHDDQRFEVETLAGARALLSGEVAEGIASFSQKRPASWAPKAPE
jgi:enoyl-CoA hydratase